AGVHGRDPGNGWSESKPARFIVDAQARHGVVICTGCALGKIHIVGESNWAIAGVVLDVATRAGPAEIEVVEPIRIAAVKLRQVIEAGTADGSIQTVRL